MHHTTRNTQQYKQKSGFTLLEMLVATLIFTIVSVAAYNGLSLIIKHDEQLTPRKLVITELSLLSTQIIDDMLHVINRPITNHLGNKQAALIINNSGQQEAIVEFTRTNPRFFGALHNSFAQRVSYKLIEQELYRGTWLYLDRSAFDVDPIYTKLMSGVEKLEISVMKSDKQVVENVFQMDSRRPRQVSFVFTIVDVGEYTVIAPF